MIDRNLIIAMAICAGCASEQMAVDPELASRAEIIHAELDSGKRDQINLGGFTIASLSPVTSSKVTTEGGPPFARHRFSYELKGKGSDWIVSCDVQVKWVHGQPEASVQELACDLVDGGGAPHRLLVSGVGPALGLKTGAVTSGQPIMEIASAHAAADPPRSFGRLLGFEITHADRVFGTVQTVSPVTIWIDRHGPEHLRALAAACAVALAFYEHMANDA